MMRSQTTRFHILRPGPECWPLFFPPFSFPVSSPTLAKTPLSRFKNGIFILQSQTKFQKPFYAKVNSDVVTDEPASFRMKRNKCVFSSVVDDEFGNKRKGDKGIKVFFSGLRTQI